MRVRKVSKTEYKDKVISNISSCSNDINHYTALLNIYNKNDGWFSSLNLKKRIEYRKNLAFAAQHLRKMVRELQDIEYNPSTEYYITDE